MSAGLLYEPRSLWSIANVTIPQSTAHETTVKLTRNHFWNGTRWPMTLERVALSGINYAFNTAPTAVPNMAADIINRVKLAISAPQRYHATSKHKTVIAAMMPRPTWTPLPEVSNSVSSIWGQSVLNLPRPLRIPKDGDIQWALSAFTPFGSGQVNQPPDPISAWMLYQETGGLFGGSARTFNAQVPNMKSTAYPIAGQQTEERWPYPPDAFVSGTAGTAAAFWAPQAEFTARSFKQQSPIRDGSGEFTQLRVMIDQRDYDDLVDSAAGSNQPAPLSTRIGTRIKTNNCGSNAFWWRQGAPLCLVFDTVTPAVVYDLVTPITLGPGDTLDVEMIFPVNTETGTAENHHVGISFNGFSAIEG